MSLFVDNPASDEENNGDREESPIDGEDGGDLKTMTRPEVVPPTRVASILMRRKRRKALTMKIRMKKRR